MVTADTITDEHLQELRDMAHRILLYVLHAKSNPSAYSDPYQMRLAQEERAFGRARCAEIINAHATKD